VTDVVPPDQAAPPPGPSAVALAIAHDLVTKYRLRLADQRDGRLGELLGQYVLAAAMWNGPRAALVAFYEPPADPTEAGRDLAARCESARRWGLDRIRQQGAQVCDILLIALGPLVGTLSVATTAGDPIRLGVAWVDAATGNAGAVLPMPPGLPSVGELRAKARAVHDGAPTPTLAAVDLAERQTVAGGYVAPVRRAMVTQPILTYTLIGIFIVIWLIETATISSASPAIQFERICSWGALPNTSFYPSIGQSPGCSIEWWRFVSSAFLHDNSNVYHVLFNSIAMLFIGRLVEQLYGRLVLLGAFLITAIAGGLFWVGASNLPLTLPGIQQTVSLGASGGIAGLVGLLLMLGRIQGKNVPVGISHTVRNYAVTVIVLNVALTFLFNSSGYINNYAHIGGLLAGAALGAAISPLAGIGGKNLNVVERSILWGAIAFSATALVVAALNLSATLIHGVPVLGP
jgi:membrane associated rhomboid family serine protease